MSQPSNTASDNTSSSTPPVTGSRDSAPAAPPASSNRATPSDTPAPAVNNALPNNESTNDDAWANTTDQLSHQFEEVIGKPSREAIHDFFYPKRNSSTSVLPPSDTAGDVSATLTRPQGGGEEDSRSSPAATGGGSGAAPATPSAPTTTAPTTTPATPRTALRNEQRQYFDQQQQQDQHFVHRFWTVYDDILILSLFTQLGIVFRLLASTWLKRFDNIFHADSPLFTVLPLNCLSCFLMGLFGSGERLMEMIHTRFSPPRLQTAGQVLDKDSCDDSDEFFARSRTASTNDVDEVESDGVMMMAANRSPTLQHRSQHSLDDYSNHSGASTSGLRQRRRRRRSANNHTNNNDNGRAYFHHWQPPVHLNEELRDVQLLALERRIRASKCLVFFPVRKEDVDVMEHYFSEGYQRNHDNGSAPYSRNNPSTPVPNNHYQHNTSFPVLSPQAGGSLTHDLELQEEDATTATGPTIHPPGSPAAVPLSGQQVSSPPTPTSALSSKPAPTTPPGRVVAAGDDEDEGMSTVELSQLPPRSTAPPPSTPDDNTATIPGQDGPDELDQYIHDVTANVSENINRLRRVNIADGWDAGTTPEAMSDDIMLGLRDGFCGALSSFSSWNSAMVAFVRRGAMGKAVVGYLLGLQLPIIAYRFGQQTAVYIFIWRCRFEAKRDERRGYGIRVSMNDNSEEIRESNNNPRRTNEDESPSLRAIITAIFIMALVTQCTSLSFFTNPENQQVAISLLFSPLGVLARWRLSQFNTWRPTFPLGTFTSNMLACALSGGLGSLLAGNPGPRERIALQSFINGFGGTMSSLATFVVEILAGMDPILLRLDGVFYACASIFWAMVIGIVFSASVDWADATE